jgi:hypothetical protein
MLVAVAPAAQPLVIPPLVAPPLVDPPLARLPGIRRLLVRCCWHQGNWLAFGSSAVNW